MIPLAACVSDPAAGPPVVVVSPEVPTAVTVVFSAPPWAGPAAVEVELDGEPVATVAAPGGRAAIVGLKPGRDYAFVPVRAGRRGTPVAHRSAELPAGLAPLTVLEAEPSSDLANGWTATALTDLEHAFVAIADPDGEWVWWIDGGPDRTFASPRVTRDGRGLLFLETDRAREADDQLAVRVELDGSARTATPVPAAHHVIAELDGGALGWLRWDIREVPWDGAVAPVLSDEVMVGDASVLSFFDDRGPAEVPCPHGLIPDERLGQEVFEWTHANSVAWDEGTDTLFVVARLLDALLAIDRTSGEVRWQLGGAAATIPWEDPGDAFSHGHASELWDGGALVFDNGSHHDPQRSRVVEYAIAEGRAEVVWTYDEPTGGFVSYLGDAVRLPSDGVLVSWSESGVLEEVARDGTVRWRAATAEGVVPGRVAFLPALPP